MDVSDRIISRDGAIDVLESLLSESEFDDETTIALMDIIECIQAENVGRHEWNMPRNDMNLLHNNVGNWTDDSIEAALLIADATAFTPSIAEKEGIMERISRDALS